MKIEISLDGVWLYEIEQFLKSWACVFVVFATWHRKWRAMIDRHYKYEYCENRYGYRHRADIVIYIPMPQSWFNRYMDRNFGITKEEL